MIFILITLKQKEQKREASEVQAVYKKQFNIAIRVKIKCKTVNKKLYTFSRKTIYFTKYKTKNIQLKTY